MNWLQKMPGPRRREAAGLEWTLWRRLPAILAVGTLMPVAFGGALGLASWAGVAPWDDRSLGVLLYVLAGIVILHWTLVLTLAIGCIVVMVMKGPAYVADAYPPPGRDGVS